MTDEVPKKIVISHHEVQSKKVDDALAQQMSFGMPVATPAADKSAWYYKSWFVLTLAGALGAFLAWLFLEPHVKERIEYVGTIDRISEKSDISIPRATMIGELRVNGAEVLLASPISKDADGKPVDLRSFREGDRVRVEGSVIDIEGAGPRDRSSSALLAFRITKVPPGTEPTNEKIEDLNSGRTIWALLIFPIVSALTGLFIGAADGIVSRAYGRAIVSALIGLGLGFGAALLLLIPAGIVFALMMKMALDANSSPDPTKLSTFAFLLLMSGRGLAWAIIGAAMGMGQGVALRSKKLFWNGVIGGVVGGLLGGILFDPINYVVGGGSFAETATSSRLVGFVVIGASVGLLIGLVELIAREAWLKMLAGPLAGKEFVIYRDPTSIGSSPKREIYLFKDPEVEQTHALIHRAGEGYEIEDQKTPAGTLVNGRKVSGRQRLKSQDQIRIGSTVLLFTMKED